MFPCGRTVSFVNAHRGRSASNQTHTDQYHPTMPTTFTGADINTRRHDPPDEIGRGPGRLLTLVQRPAVRLGLLVVLIAVALGVVSTTGDLSKEGLRDAVQGLGWLAPVAYVGIYAFLTVAFFPGLVLTTAAGFIFGPIEGTVIAVTGATLGACLSFLVGRGLGRDGVQQLGAERVDKLDRFLSERGFVSVLIVRLIPLFPFNVVNYVAGVTGLKFREYALATFIGIIPGGYAYAALGGNIDDLTSPGFLGAVALVIVLAVGGGIYAKRTSAPTDR